MALLDGYINANPTGVGGPEVAIVDSVALEATIDNTSSVFIDFGRSGTGEISTYVVRRGDTLSEIAEMFGVSTNTIVWANDIKNGKIREGQELVILPITGVKHIVKKGDTLRSIATKYKADLDDITLYNGLSLDAKIAVGDEVIIPDGEIVNTSSSKSSSKASKTIKGYPEHSGYYLRPIVGGRKSQGVHGHNAVDLAAPTGTPIMASADGRVIISRKAGYNGGYGLYVAIAHPNGTQTVYGHMSRNDVTVGQQVKQGQVIGAVGSTGRSTGPHIHFEIRGAKNPF